MACCWSALRTKVPVGPGVRGARRHRPIAGEVFRDGSIGCKPCFGFTLVSGHHRKVSFGFTTETRRAWRLTEDSWG